MSAVHTLLIVDDCPEDREVYREFLSCDPHQTYEFIEASLAEVGLELFSQHHCDAILLDFCMPDMDGLEFLSELQNCPEKDRPPIIMLTGQGDEAVAVKAMKQGIQDYLGKQHLQPEILQLTVRNVIQQSHLHALLSQTRERQRLIATTALRIRQSLDLDQILDTALAEVQQILECDHVAIYQCLSQPKPEIRAELGTRCHRSFLNANQALSSRICPGNSDVSIDGSSDLSSGLVQASLTELGAPIVITATPAQEGQTWGYLIAHQCSKSTPWHPEEQGIIRELAVQLAIAIQQSELLSRTQTALEKAQELNHFKSQIIATVSHEYRSPLAAILGAASTLDRHSDQLKPARQAHFLRMIQDKARHMAKLVDDMLIMHQCELDQAKFEPVPMNLLQFLADLVEEHRETVGEHHEFVFKVSGRTHGFWGDPGVLRLVLDNLLSNADKYSPDGGEIEISLVGEKNAVTISIQDQGIGIPVEDQAALFQSFSRGSNVGHIPGTGLGLAIAKACIDLHSGEITLASKLNQGTQIEITLPKEPPASRNIYLPEL